jgi:hypothetical protein
LSGQSAVTGEVSVFLIFQKNGNYFIVIAPTGLFDQVAGSFKITSSSQTQSGSEAKFLADLKINWEKVQTQISFRPSYHNQAANKSGIWGSPWRVQFIGNNIVFAYIEDDSNPQLLLLRLSNGSFKLVNTYKNKGQFTLKEWQDIVSKYGDKSYPVSTYTVSMVNLKTGEVINYPQLTKVSENLFVGP